MKRRIFSFLLLFAFAAHAQSDTVDLTPVEVRSVQAGATAPFTKTNINKASIEKNNLGQDLPFVLNTTPSVVAFSDAGNGVGYTGLRIRGTDASRINVSLNGIPFNDPESSQPFFVDLPDFLSSVNSIQIQRGVGTSSNGPGAFGATITLSTTETFSKPYAELNNSYGSFSTLKNTLRAGTGLLNDHFTVDLRLSSITSDGFIDRASSNLKSYYISAAYIAAKTTVRFNHFSGRERTYQAWTGVPHYKLFYNKDSLLAHYYNNLGTAYFTAADSVNLFHSDTRTYNPFLYKDQTDNYQQDHYQLFFNHKLRPKTELNAGAFYVRGKGYYEQYRNGETYSKYGLADVVTGTDTVRRSDFVRQLWLDNHFYGTVFSLQHAGVQSSVTAGGAFTWYDGGHHGDVIWAGNGMSGPAHRWYDLPSDKNDFTFYTKWQQKLNPALQLFADLQWRYVQHRITGFRDNPTLGLNNKYNFFNPKLGVSYNRNNWTLYTSYSIGHKEPNRDDFEARVTEQPRPEQLRDLEMGVQKRSRTAAYGATLYYMKYKDQLVLTGKVNDVGAYTRTNIKNSYRAGVELEGTTALTEWLRISGNLALSRNCLNDFSEYIDDFDNGGQKTNHFNERVISFSPATVGSAVVALMPAKNLEVNFITKYVSKQYLDNTQHEARKLDAYATQDVKAVYSFSGKLFKNLMLIAQVNNVFNTLYTPNGYTFSYYYANRLITENYYFPMAGINWTVGLNVGF
jgi:iron complex outermembrane receptor protein